MARRPSQLAQTLRAIVLSTPFVQALALPGCCLEVVSDVVVDGGPNPALQACPPMGRCREVDALPPGFVSEGGPLPCETLCSRTPQGCELCSNEGTPSVYCYYDCTGRRPSRLRSAPRPPATKNPLATLWRQIAHLEASSVIAFRVLERELRGHDAPAVLIAEARRAARDEIRHARVTAGLCRSYGGRPVRPSIPPSHAPRSMMAIARENAVEGCVRETYGALSGLWQAQHAGDPETRRAMRRIAADEARHAELAWSVAAWAEPRLTTSARRDIAAARGEAFVELLSSTNARMPAAYVTVAGLPPPAVARLLAERMGQALSIA